MLAAKSEILFEGSNSNIYLLEENEWGVPVIQKVIPSSSDNAPLNQQINNEYEILLHLQKVPGVRRAFKKTFKEGNPSIILEYISGRSLQDVLRQGGLTLLEKLSLSSKICQVLGDIHKNNVIHKDIDSKNILLSESEEVYIIDFGISSRINLKAQSLASPERLEGTLAYISPEQTGRMNRIVDYRSDLYSLGVLLYELFTGRLPFQSEDPMELVHSHLAQSPLPLDKLNATIPKTLSDIILMLMRKNAEDRYQSAFGLKHDLDKCIESLKDNNYIEEFELARNDFSGKFQIPQKLYGRQQEIGYLLDAFERSCQGSAELLLVSGYSGVGKSALVHEIHKPITERQGHFIEGKFDQFQRNIPYFAFIQAFKGFVNRLLTGNTRQLEKWKARIMQAVGNNGKVLTDVIPALELIIGKQDDIPELGASEAQNRFNLVFQNFVNIISKRDHPLVIFIDDWQWADAASLNLLRILLTNRSGDHMLLIGSFRQNEVDESHPFMMMVEQIRKENPQILELKLSNLSIENLQDLIVDALKVKPEMAEELSSLLHQKTQGNAFFVTQMLKSLYEEGLLSFDFEARSWVWDIQKIQSLNITDNVVNLMSAKIQKLPEVTQETLKLAACIGNRFSMHHLAIIDESEGSEHQESTKKNLESALLEGLVIPLEQEYKFAHDRVQQAVYAMISPEERPRIHLKIGKLLLEHTPVEERENIIFDITNQWNFGINLLEDPDDKRFLAGLNLEVGKKAKDSAAYKPAFNYLKIAIDLLPENAWEEDYAFTLIIYSEILQVAFLKGDLELTNHYIQVILEKAKSTLEKMPAFEIEMQYYIAKGDLKEAINAGLRVLDLLDVSLSEAPREDIEVEKLADLPEIDNPEIQAALEIMDSIISPAWSTNPELFQKITYTMVNLSWEYGNSASACVGYAFYGGLLCGLLGDIDQGYAVGKLAVKLLDRFNAKFFKSKVDNLYISTVMHWKEPARATRKPYQEAIQIGLETGEIEFASFNIVESCHYNFLMGISLDSLRQKYRKNMALIRQLKQDFHLHYLAPWKQLIHYLSQEEDLGLVLRGEFYDEEESLPTYIEEQQLTLAFIVYEAKMMLAFYLGLYKEAAEFAQEAHKYQEGVTGMLFMPVHNFFHSLSLIAYFPQASPEEKRAFLPLIEENQRQLKSWASYSPANCLHKYHLVQAETMRLSGQNMKAMDLYDLAIDEAKEHMYIQEEALSNELAARFYLGLGKDKIARAYIQDAYFRYQLWGATRKLRQMEEEYAEHLKRNSRGGKSLSSSATSSTTSPNLDMNSIIKASQALSGEVVLGRLLSKMMRIVIENAGAEKGLFILEKDGKWVLEADCTLNQEEVESMQSLPIEDVNGLSDDPRLSSELVFYVIRTKKSVVINDASQEGAIVGPTYMQKIEPKSILCMPLMNHGELTGILYLENNLTTDAFTPDRLEILKILSTQITISLENALLYENLEEKVKERTEEVVKAKEIIEKKNQDITSSINYAKRIQDATLPLVEDIKEHLPNSFVFFQPRDIVSGDFYWCSKVGRKAIYEDSESGGGEEEFNSPPTLKGYESEKVIITASDCTGHGVPGAFMSMIGNDLLNGIVDLQGITKADVILNKLHHGVRHALRQEESDNKDGMDMALCVIDQKNKVLEYAGAKNPLVYIQNNQLHEIKADKMPIGGVRKRGERVFTSHAVKFEEPTTFYIFSDGYQDQFGGPQGRKFMVKRLKNLFLEIHQKPMVEQQHILSEKMRDWMGTHRQIDDILIIGFRLG